MSTLFPHLGTLTEAQQRRRATPKIVGKSRLEEKFADDKLKVVDEKAFRAEVIARDGRVCRCCGRKVVQTKARVPNRLEVHHIHGKIGVLKFEARAALVLCLSDHAKVTGKVSERWAIVPTKTFVLDGRELTDARAPVLFKKVA